MKGYKFLGIFCILSILIFLLILIPKVNAYVYSVNYSCEKDICIVGKEMEWIINFNNQEELAKQISKDVEETKKLLNP